jgi:ABC-type phosphate transport system ATPase subunit
MEKSKEKLNEINEKTENIKSLIDEIKNQLNDSSSKLITFK